MTEHVRVDRSPAEPTLAALATAFARRAVPSRLYLALQLLLPWAVDFAIRGWWGASALAAGVALFGAWGLLDGWLARRAPEGVSGRIGRAGRAIAGALAAALLALFVLGLFLRALGAGPIS